MSVSSKENYVDQKKRDSLKKAAIGAAAVGVGLVGLSSVANAGEIIFRQNGTDYSVSGVSKSAIGVNFDGMGSVLSTGLKAYLVVPYKCTISSWYLIGDQSGSVVVDIWKSNWQSFPPLVANTITGTEKPTLTLQQTNQLETLSSWTTSVSAGDVLCFNIDSAITIKKLLLVLKVEKN